MSTPRNNIPFAGYDPKFCPGSNPENPEPDPGPQQADTPYNLGWTAGWGAHARANPRQVEDAKPVAPWSDFLEQPICHGDRLIHPDGTEFVAVRLNGHADESDAWRAVYDDPHVSRLCLQIGNKGRAVLVECPQSVTGKPAQGVNAMRRPLMEAQIMELPAYWLVDDMGGLVAFARAIEAAHNIKE